MFWVTYKTAFIRQ